MKLSTKIIHSGLGGDQKPTGSVITPIFQTSTYIQKSPGKNLGYEGMSFTSSNICSGRNGTSIVRSIYAILSLL